MKNRYRLFLRRKSVYYAFDDTTKKFESLKTHDKAVAERLLLAMNEAGKQPAMNLGLARVYPRHLGRISHARSLQGFWNWTDLNRRHYWSISFGMWLYPYRRGSDSATKVAWFRS